MLTRYVVLLVIGFGLTFCEDTIFDLAKEGDLEAVKEKIENGSADSNATDEDGRTVLQIAVSSGSLDVVKYLVEIDTDDTSKNIDALQLLSYAVEAKKLNVVKYLVKKFNITDLNTRKFGFFRRTLLHQAVKSGSLDVVKYLVEEGADPNAIARFGHTVLHRAARVWLT